MVDEIAGERGIELLFFFILPPTMANLKKTLKIVECFKI
jgi:hypothetical protein